MSMLVLIGIYDFDAFDPNLSPKLLTSLPGLEVFCKLNSNCLHFEFLILNICTISYFCSESGEMCAMKEVTLFSDDAKSKESAKQLMQVH